jgi:hypothetical protein
MVVISAPFCNGVNSSRNPGFPVKTGTQSLRWFRTFVGTTFGFRVKPGMTAKRLYGQTLSFPCCSFGGYSPFRAFSLSLS